MEDKYWEVFNTDWNKGTESKMKLSERIRIHNLWLEYNRESFKKIVKQEPEQPVQGFVKDKEKIFL